VVKVTDDTITSVSLIYCVFNNFSANIVRDEIRLRLELNTVDILVAHVITHTECSRRNVPFFGREFVRFRYIDTTNHPYIRSSTVMEMTTENCKLAVQRTVPV